MGPGAHPDVCLPKEGFCKDNPTDPLYKTTIGAVDCNTNPNDPSCGPQPPVDCKTKPDDPSCTTPPPVDCKANPNDASCTTDRSFCLCI
ncbi:MAG: hypothetical protein M3247_03950 [Thermoproteota archaeon]|nr:hypothetical protein [Thermoproteota archaeon]